jgi:hypothetical protein
MGTLDSPFRKSSYSDTSGDCLEAGTNGGAVGVRDTKDIGQGLVLTFSSAAWERFTVSLRQPPRG